MKQNFLQSIFYCNIVFSCLVWIWKVIFSVALKSEYGYLAYLLVKNYSKLIIRNQRLGKDQQYLVTVSSLMSRGQITWRFDGIGGGLGMTLRFFEVSCWLAESDFCSGHDRSRNKKSWSTFFFSSFFRLASILIKKIHISFSNFVSISCKIKRRIFMKMVILIF